MNSLIKILCVSVFALSTNPLYASSKNAMTGEDFSKSMRESLQGNKIAFKPIYIYPAIKENKVTYAELYVRLAIEMILESLRLGEMSKADHATTALNAGQDMFCELISAGNNNYSKEQVNTNIIRKPSIVITDDTNDEEYEDEKLIKLAKLDLRESEESIADEILQKVDKIGISPLLRQIESNKSDKNKKIINLLLLKSSSVIEGSFDHVVEVDGIVVKSKILKDSVLNETKITYKIADVNDANNLEEKNIETKEYFVKKAAIKVFKNYSLVQYLLFNSLDLLTDDALFQLAKNMKELDDAHGRSQSSIEIKDGNSMISATSFQRLMQLLRDKKRMTNKIRQLEEDYKKGFNNRRSQSVVK